MVKELIAAALILVGLAFVTGYVVEANKGRVDSRVMRK